MRNIFIGIIHSLICRIEELEKIIEEERMKKNVRRWRLGFCCKWFKDESFVIFEITLGLKMEDYVGFVGIQIAKFVIGIYMSKEV
jgi:hypothetical protein